MGTVIAGCLQLSSIVAAQVCDATGADVGSKPGTQSFNFLVVIEKSRRMIACFLLGRSTGLLYHYFGGYISCFIKQFYKVSAL